MTEFNVEVAQFLVTWTERRLNRRWTDGRQIVDRGWKDGGQREDRRRTDGGQTADRQWTYDGWTANGQHIDGRLTADRW